MSAYSKDLTINLKSKSLRKRFWKKVRKDPETGCWVWTAGKSPKGYGVFNVGKFTRQAHRLSWMFKNGLIESDLQVMHDCPCGDNPACVNPAHLLLGTPKEHTADKIKKGQYSPPPRNDLRGEKSPLSKLTDYQRNVLIPKMRKKGMAYEDIAKALKVSKTRVGVAVREVLGKQKRKYKPK